LLVKYSGFVESLKVFKYSRPRRNCGFKQDPENYKHVFEWMNRELGDRKLEI